MASTGYQPRPNSLSDFSSKDSNPHHQPKDNSDLRLYDPRNSAEHRETINSSSDVPETLPGAEIDQSTTAMHPEKASSNVQNARRGMGLHPVAPVIHEHDVAEHSDWWWSRVRLSLKEPFAEVCISVPGSPGLMLSC